MMFESVQYVEASRSSTRRAWVPYGEGNGPAGLLGFMDDRDRQPGLRHAEEDHGFHDNEYMDPHTMVTSPTAA